MTLALLLTAVTGAWAADTYTVAGSNSAMFGTAWDASNTANDMTKNGDGTYSITYTNVSLDDDVQYKVVKDHSWNEAYPDGENRVITIAEAGTYTVTIHFNPTTHEVYETMPGSDSGEPDVDVTTNAASEQDLFTEAKFTMPAFDATVNYELVRDMSIQMTAQVGDGTQEQPRYRVKKDGNKFIPADMEMAAVPALFTVNDAIEQKALTQTQDYIVQIYAIDAEGQPTGQPMTFATFTFEPGIYAVKAVAADGSDYDGETALSNTFQLFQGYEVEVAAKEFITYYKDEPLYADTETSADAVIYTIQSVNGDQATLSAAIETAPSRTPLLIFNNSDEAKTFLLIPANEEPNLQLTVAPEFVGTLEATTIAASTDDQTNYAFNGKAFVFVKNDLPVAANKAWLSINTGVPSARITLVFDETTKITTTNITNITNGEWYTIDGRKVNAPSKKGIYIMNGRKVVVK